MRDRVRDKQGGSTAVYLQSFIKANDHGGAAVAMTVEPGSK